MLRLSLVLAVALPIMAMSQETKKEPTTTPAPKQEAEPTEPQVVNQFEEHVARQMKKKTVAKKPAKRKDGKLLNIAADGTITYHVDRDSAVRAIVAKLQEEKALRAKNETLFVNEIDRLRGKLQRIESNCKKKR